MLSQRESAVIRHPFPQKENDPQKISSVECACFLPCETEVIALGCNQSQLRIFSRKHETDEFDSCICEGWLPKTSLTSLRVLPADDAADLSRSDSVRHVCHDCSLGFDFAYLFSNLTF